MENTDIINSDKEFLKWIYERMICVHGEKDLYDYMINFKAIIDRSGSVAAPKEEKSEDFGKLKWKVGQILAEQFLKYNDGKFIAAIELNPATHALTEFIESENTALREALKELLPVAENELHQSTCVGYSYIKLKAIIERARKLISK